MLPINKTAVKKNVINKFSDAITDECIIYYDISIQN